MAMPRELTPRNVAPPAVNTAAGSAFTSQNAGRGEHRGDQSSQQDDGEPQAAPLPVPTPGGLRRRKRAAVSPGAGTKRQAQHFGVVPVPSAEM